MGLGSGGGALKGGNRLIDNLGKLKDRFQLNNRGYFGIKGKGRDYTRNIESSNPARTAAEFAAIAGENPVSAVAIEGKGMVYRMRDGSVITHRFSSTSDGTPVVDINVKDVPGVKAQKIHFTKKGRSNGKN